MALIPSNVQKPTVPTNGFPPVLGLYTDQSPTSTSTSAPMRSPSTTAKPKNRKDLSRPKGQRAAILSKSTSSSPQDPRCALVRKSVDMALQRMGIAMPVKQGQQRGR